VCWLPTGVGGTIPGNGGADLYDLRGGAYLRDITVEGEDLAANGELEAERDEAGHWAFPARALRAQMPDRPPRDTPDITEGEANQGGGRPAPEAWIEKQVLLGVGTSGAWVSGELREVNDRGVTIRVRSEGQGEAAYVFYPWSNVQGIRKPDEEATERRR
jgi:hypothetical protein